MNLNKVSTRLPNVGCLIAVIIQISNLAYHQIHPSQTVTSTQRENLSDIDFPVVFKICIKPGFNTTALTEVGYDNAWDYFEGTSRHNSSLVGWAGHKKNGMAFSNVTGQTNIVARIKVGNPKVLNPSGIGVNLSILFFLPF